MTQWPNGSKTQQPAISSPFGPRSGGAFSFHYGADMVGFSEIRAVDGGLVTFSGWLNNAAGWTVAVDIGGGVTHLYMHNAINHVARGFRVTEGQLLATMGRSGNATGNCLHFEVRVNGTSVEPLQWVRERLPNPAPAGGGSTNQGGTASPHFEIGDDMFIAIRGSHWFLIVPQGNGKPQAVAIGGQDKIEGIPKVTFNWDNSWNRLRSVVSGLPA